MSNRVQIDGVWHGIDDLSEYALSRLHSVTYDHGHVWQIRFGSTVLELTAEQALELKRVCEGVDDAMMYDDLQPYTQGDYSADLYHGIEG